MKVAAIPGLAIVAALAGAVVSAPAAAQPYGNYYDNGRNPCQDKQHNNGTAGALIGGAAGALLGNGLAHGGGRVGGTVIGGAAGAVIGNNIGRSTAQGSDTCQEQRAYENGAPPPGYYQGGQYGYAAPPPPAGYYQQAPGYGYQQPPPYRGGYDEDDE